MAEEKGCATFINDGMKSALTTRGELLQMNGRPPKMVQFALIDGLI